MEFSIAFFSSLDEPGADAYEQVVRIAKYADSHGFRALWLPERHFHAFGGLFPNPAVVAAGLARETERIALCAGSVVAPLHDPVRIVEEWSVVDNLSGGRVELAFASGWNADDFVFFPDRYLDRKAVTLETASSVRELWAKGTATRVNGVGAVVELPLHPRPVQPDLPVWVTSAGAPTTMRAAGQTGSNVLTHVVDQDLDVLAERIRTYRQAVPTGTAGRVALMLHTYVGDDEAQVDSTVGEPLREYLRSSMRLEVRTAAHDGTGTDGMGGDLFEDLVEHSYARYRSTTSLIGSREACIQRVRQLQELGVDEIACLVDFGVDPDEVLAALDRLNDVRAACA